MRISEITITINYFSFKSWNSNISYVEIIHLVFPHESPLLTQITRSKISIFISNMTYKFTNRNIQNFELHQSKIAIATLINLIAKYIEIIILRIILPITTSYCQEHLIVWVLCRQTISSC